MIEEEISNKIFERNRIMIIEQVGGMVDTASNLSRVRMWKIKQKVCPKTDISYPVAVAVVDLITNKADLKNLYVRTYKERLRHREIRPDYAQLKDLKNGLFEIRNKLSKIRKTESWSQNELSKVLEQLKTNKAADPKGLISEIFKPGVAGADLTQSLLILCNKVKEECQLPAFLEWTNISSIYKNKGVKTDLNNDRGVFNVMTVRSIIDNLMYNDFYDIIDQNMSDSNVGGRKERNIRDNLFIVYGVINYALQNNIEVDLNLYDLAKCFDSMWYQETMNDLWDSGVTDDKFSLIGKLNENCNIAIKTPVGITDRFKLSEIEMQGTMFSNIKCSVQIDTLGKECYSSGEGLFLYKDGVYIPPLGMIDDIASFSLSGVDSVKTNAIINAKIESKKLEFGPAKCFTIHIGSKESTSSDLKVHDHVIKVKDYETYLGDIISNTGSNERNIENRRNQGLGAINQIYSMLNLTSLGHFHFEISMVLRDAILVSKLVYNSEVWYNLTDSQIVKLEQIDEMFFRRILDVPKTTPKVGLYIEFGKIPLKFIMKMRRMMYYWHILTRNEDELLQKFYNVQKFSPSKFDWVNQIQKDKAELKLELSEVNIKSMKYDEFKSIMKKKMEQVNNKRKKKTENISLTKFSPKEYFLSKNLSVTEVKNLFKIRTSMIDVKSNFHSTNDDNMWCRTCNLFTETQEHLVNCPPIREKLKGLVNFNLMNPKMVFNSIQDQEFYSRNYTMILNARRDLLSPDDGDQ